MTPHGIEKKIKVTPEFLEAVATFKTMNNLSSWNAALLKLACIGYETTTGKAPPPASFGRGGWQGNANSLKALVKRKKDIKNE